MTRQARDKRPLDCANAGLPENACTMFGRLISGARNAHAIEIECDIDPDALARCDLPAKKTTFTTRVIYGDHVKWKLAVRRESLTQAVQRPVYPVQISLLPRRQ